MKSAVSFSKTVAADECRKPKWAHRIKLFVSVRYYSLMVVSCGLIHQLYLRMPAGKLSGIGVQIDGNDTGTENDAILGLGLGVGGETLGP